MTANSYTESFLNDDLYDALKWLFVGAVTWYAHPEAEDKDYLRALGMFTCFVQARALYEFFYCAAKTPAPAAKGSTAFAQQFVPLWKANDPQKLYEQYMAKDTPAQKRVFHLVYGRSEFSGGTAVDESEDLKNQVLSFAKDLKRLTEEFASCLAGRDRQLVEDALQNALQASETLAKRYGKSNPLP